MRVRDCVPSLNAGNRPFQGRFSMSDLFKRDTFGREVLIGLTYAETIEFGALDATSPFDEFGRGLEWETDDNSFPPNERRWLQLYQKHRSACLKRNRASSQRQ